MNSLILLKNSQRHWSNLIAIYIIFRSTITYPTQNLRVFKSVGIFKNKKQIVIKFVHKYIGVLNFCINFLSSYDTGVFEIHIFEFLSYIKYSKVLSNVCISI